MSKSLHTQAATGQRTPKVQSALRTRATDPEGGAS